MRRDPASESLIQANAENTYEVGPGDLPLACPMPGMQLWNSHPRVYLAIEATGQAKCPYCGAVYVLHRERPAA
jgi:uncharacterized Zn-finger protein